MGRLLEWGKRRAQRLLPCRATVKRETGRGANVLTKTVAEDVAYRRDDSERARLAAIAGGAASTNAETLYVLCADLQPKDLLVDARDATLRFRVDGIGDATDGVVRTVYATRQVGP
jgi:hypothetical protein